jgi:sugar phosphate isomerase/epimerase
MHRQSSGSRVAAGPAQRNLSLSYYTVPELSFLEMMSVAAQTGCTHVGVRLLDGAPDGPGTQLMENAALRRAAREHMAALKLTPLEASAARIRPATQVAAFESFLASCAELGVRHVMCTIDDEVASRGAARLMELCDLALRYGLRIEIEFVPWMTVGSLTDAAALVRTLGAKNLGIVVDALHFARSHSRVDDLAALPPDWFHLLQICDAPACTDYSTEAQLHVATQERLLPGEGVIPLAALIRAMPDHIPIALEIPTATLARTLPALARVQRAVAATRAVLADAEKMTTALPIEKISPSPDS